MSCSPHHREAEERSSALSEELEAQRAETERLREASGEEEAAAKLRAAEAEVAALTRKLENDAMVQVGCDAPR